MAFYFVSTFANAQTPTKQRPYGYRRLKIFTSLKLRFQDFQRPIAPPVIAIAVALIIARLHYVWVFRKWCVVIALPVALCLHWIRKVVMIMSL
ncbi:hypothetical protein [Bathymodiolus japonicus methanotrophic gill symbiont]|uniref:hypothetical protein n=1 Tax=Bathymodiolus japonicus methanotrophic gill symbiont TaxID=113269 RepID=UPI001C8EE711|nr:hypothetical protein [Bathymodiolus japonicus methanotrophic gill symbiont]